MRKIPYPHPGEILLEEFLKPMGITQYRLAKEIGVPQRCIGEIVAGSAASLQIPPPAGALTSRPSIFKVTVSAMDLLPFYLKF